MRILRLARDLGRRKAREREGLFTAEGTRIAEDLLRSGMPIVGALISPTLGATPRGAALRDALIAAGVDVASVTEAEFESAAETDSPQGVLVIAQVPRRSLRDERMRHARRVLVLDAVQDPGNVGTILRTAAALGTDVTIALPGTVDLWNAKVVRSAMGAHFVHPALHSTWDDLRLFLHETAMPLWGADASGPPLEHPIDPMSRLALAVGNEGAGLTPPVRDAVTRLVSLPLAGGIESLNVAVATGILLYELRP